MRRLRSACRTNGQQIYGVQLSGIIIAVPMPLPDFISQRKKTGEGQPEP